MSKLTSFLGGVAGGIIGFVVSGFNPAGAWIGFGIGLGVATLIDPIVPDIPSPGEPMGELEIMTNQEGIPLPDVLGTTKMTGNLLYYGNNWRQTLTEEVDSGGGSGGGGSQTVTTGYRYFLSWAMGFCLGPVDTLYTVWLDNDIVWEGELGISSATKGEVTIALWKGDRDALEGYESGGGAFLGGLLDAMWDQAAYAAGYIGLMTFYFGTSDQEVNDQLTDLMLEEGGLEDETWAIPYRRQCYAYMHDCVIGSYNRCPSIKIIVRKAPECSFDT